MLSRQNGASKLAYVLRKSTQSTLNHSKVRKDTMRSAISSWTRRVLPAKTSVPSTTNSRLWQPQNGIVFDISSVPRNTSSLQSTSQVGIESDEDEVLSLRKLAEDYYAAASSIGADDTETQETNDGEYLPKNKSTKSEAISEETATEVESEETPLSFQMPPELFEKAKNAKPGSPESYWSHTLYRRPAKPGSKVAEEKVVVHYCKSKQTSETVAKLFKEDKVIGFDIEWSVPLKAGAKNNVSLIQIANDERVALFHIAMFAKNEIDDLVPPTLKEIMENPKITKVGVAIRGDCTRLRKHLNIDSKGIFELSHLYRLNRYTLSGETKQINKKLVSLQTQVEENFGLPMFKGEEVRSSDWSQALKMDQIVYAASDSYAGLRLYDALEAQRKQLKPTPPRPYHAELMLPIRLADGIMIETTEEQTEEGESSDPTLNQDATITTTTPTSNSTTTPTPTSTKPKPKEKPPATPPKPEVQAADLWVIQWKSTLPKVHEIRATNRQLQTYALWHIQGFNVSEVAALLREQPLAISTVKNYVLQAVQLECLEFDKGRMKELLAGLGDSELSRYRRIVGQLGP